MSSLQSAHRSEGCNIKAVQEGVLVMTREQKIVAIGSASGVATMIAAVVGIYQIWPNDPSLTDAASRLAYTVQANAFARSEERRVGEGAGLRVGASGED